MKFQKHAWMLGLAGAVAASAALAGPKNPAVSDADFQAMMQRSFRAEGIATLERLTQDSAQAACSGAQPPKPKVAARIQAEALATVRPPADGVYLGDWKEGEKLAQSGRGLTWTDKSAEPSANGANCYNCHQITKAEVAFGTIGPSLYQYGKLRGVSDPSAPAAQAVVQYTWGKLHNAWAYNACSNMPRFGFKHLLNEQQLKHVMALLLDPKSPVNAE